MLNKLRTTTETAKFPQKLAKPNTPIKPDLKIFLKQTHKLNLKYEFSAYLNTK